MRAQVSEEQVIGVLKALQALQAGLGAEDVPDDLRPWLRLTGTSASSPLAGGDGEPEILACAISSDRPMARCRAA